MEKKKFYITTPIYYPSDKLHIGHTYCTVATDAMARYKRLTGCDVMFLTGTDEHGQKIAETAEKNGMTPQAWCDSLAPAFTDAWKTLDIDYTNFVRTTEDRQTRAVQKFWQGLYDAGWLYKSAYEGWYCVHEETYYAESDLEKNEDGEFVCPDCKRPVQKAGGEENWFFKLSEFGDKLLAFYDIDPQAPVHFLVIPKQHIASAAALTEDDAALLGHIYAVIAQLCKKLGVDESGYRVVTNVGADGGQSVKHLHFHVLAKRSLAWPPG